MGPKRAPERDIEAYLVRKTRELGGWAVKLNPVNLAGIPDRMLLFSGAVVFVEVKAPGFKPRPLQQFRAAQLKRLGYDCYAVDNKPAIDELLKLVVGCTQEEASE